MLEMPFYFSCLLTWPVARTGLLRYASDGQTNDWNRVFAEREGCVSEKKD